MYEQIRNTTRTRIELMGAQVFAAAVRQPAIIDIDALLAASRGPSAPRPVVPVSRMEAVLAAVFEKGLGAMGTRAVQ
jgi:hypothetical protein